MDWDNPQAEELLRDIVAWVGATKSTSGQLGQMVLNHGGFVPLLQKRGLLKAETARLLYDFMAAFPDQYALPAALAAKLKDAAIVGTPWRPERHRSMLMRFGYHDHASLSDDTLMRRLGVVEPEPVEAVTAPPGGGEGSPFGKPRVSAAVIRAAKLDGRDLPSFVTALIEMGLECWREDRRAQGEMVA